MNARAKVNELLSECGAVFKRGRKHEVYELPNGKNFVRAATPSDRRSDLNNLSDLKRQLEIVKPAENKGASPTRTKLIRRKSVKGQSSTERMKSKVASLSLSESLRMAGLTDDVLRDRVSDVETRICELERRQIAMEQQLARSWALRFQRLVESWFK